MTMAEFDRRLQRFDIVQVSGSLLAQKTDRIKALNIKQLMAGQDRWGKYLSPKYSEDPYFKTAAQAKAYADWKKKLYPETPYDIPNLIIRGDYHNSITVGVDQNKVTFNASTSLAPFASDVESKYKGNQLGLTPYSKRQAWIMIIKGVVHEFCRQTGAKSK